MENPAIKPIGPLNMRAGVLLVLLLILGCLGNYFTLPLFFGADFIFGSIAVFLVLTFYGLGWGMVAAVLANSFTYLLWGHPYGGLTFITEALFVGYFLRSGSRNLVLLDGLFWLLVGMPLAYVFHTKVLHLGPIIGAFIMLQQGINGVFNALLASLAVNHLPFEKFLEPGAPRRTTSLRETLLNLMVAVILLPALVIMIFNSREGVKEGQDHTIDNMQIAGANIVAQLSLWHQQNLHAVTQLAELAAKTSLEPSPALQHDTEVIEKAHARFRSMLVANAQGTSISCSPAVSAEGQSNIGINYADRRYYQDMLSTKRPVVSEVLIGRVMRFPVVTVSVPIFRGENFRGYALGVLNLHGIQEMLQPFGEQLNLGITLVDSQGQVIISTMSDRKPLVPWVRQGGTVQPLRGSVYQWLPDNRQKASMARWKNSFYVGEYSIPDLPWKLVVEAPLAPLQKNLYLLYVRNLAIMTGLTVVVLLLSVLFTRWLVRPLAGLALVTSNLPDKLLANRDITWPESSATEMHSLVANFKTMARSLTAYIQGLKAANIDLTAEIDELIRVEAALRDSEARYRLLADNARDVIWRMDENQQLSYVSPSVQLLTGFSPEDTMDRGLAGMLTPASLQAALDMIAQLQEVELREKPAVPPAVTLEVEVLRQDGGTIWGEAHATLLRDSQGRFAGFMGVLRDTTERRLAEAALRESEQRVRLKLESILSPEGDLGNLELADIIDVPTIQSLMDDFYELAHFPMSLIDLQGKVLVGVGWQDVCTKFHRTHPKTYRYCLESNTQLSQDVPPGEFRPYKCKNQMWNIATPIVIGGHHLGNLFSGQFFFEDESLDYGLFRSQARKYCFDEKAYLAALERVPRLSRETVNAGMAFLIKLANMLSLLSYSNIKLARTLTERAALTESLRESQERLNLALAAAQMGVWEWNIQTDAVFWSPECYEITGLEGLKELTLADFINLVHPEDLDRIMTASRRAIEAKEVYAEDFRIIRPSGEVRWVTNLARTEYDNNDHPLRMVGTVMDITARQETEEEVIRQREELRGLATRLAMVEEEERQNLARELHDQVCQNLAMLGLTLESLKIKAQQEPLQLLLSKLGDAAVLVEQTGEITRELMEGLRPTVLDHYGLLEALRRWAEQFSQRTGIRVDVQGKEAIRLAPPVELALFRIAQEALNNVAKHARATRVVLTEEEVKGTVHLSIADNGVGFDLNPIGDISKGRHHWGLMTMRERALAVGGRCRIESEPGRGTQVMVEVSL
ncbi:MAG: PocR ligand-binding domain-containing protein [Thermodesulfobacteriota bacterium]